MTHCSLYLLGSSNSPASASWVAGTMSMYHHIWLVLFLVEMGFHHDVQLSLKLLTSGDLPILTSQSAGITGVSHRECGHFSDTHSSDSWASNVFPLVCVISDFFQQCFCSFPCRVLSPPWLHVFLDTSMCVYYKWDCDPKLEHYRGMEMLIFIYIIYEVLGQFGEKTSW